MPRSLCLAVLALGAALIAPPAAGAAIDVNTSIAGVRPGMSEKQVRERLGRPSSVTRGSATTYRYARRELTITFVRGDALLIQTASRSERTRSGVGVGSSRRRVRRRVRGVHCGDGPFAQCVTRGEGRITTFQLKDNRVAVVSLLDA